MPFPWRWPTVKKHLFGEYCSLLRFDFGSYSSTQLFLYKMYWNWFKDGQKQCIPVWLQRQKQTCKDDVCRENSWREFKNKVLYQVDVWFYFSFSSLVGKNDHAIPHSLLGVWLSRIRYRRPTEFLGVMIGDELVCSWFNITERITSTIFMQG